MSDFVASVQNGPS